MTKLLPAILLLSVLAWTGCANYQLGRQAPLPFERLYVAPVVNDSFAPQAQAVLTEQLARQFLTSGAVTLVKSPEQADAILTVTIVDFRREVAATQDDDTGLGESFLLYMTSNSDLVDAETGKPYFKARRNRAEVRTLIDSGLQPAEYQSMPVLTRDLARSIKETVLSTW